MKSVFILLSVILFSCAHSQNYKSASIIQKDAKLFIKLKGKREYMVHNPGDLTSNKTYEDSILIEIPEWKQGVIEGKNIPVEAGHYKFQGNISIDKSILKVNLLINDTDDKILRPCSWNGEYIIKKVE